MSDPFELPDPFGEAPLGAPTPDDADMSYLDTLNDEQRAAVEAIDGPVLVLAGAGTGKTRVLTTRLAHILRGGRARPYEILAVTFTNKAAREMRERVEQLAGIDSSGLWLGTFHAIGARILRRHAELVGLQSSFTILDTDDQIRLLKQLMAAEHIDEKRWPAKALSAVIQRWKDKAYRPDSVPVAEQGEFANGRAVELYAAYQERLKVLNAVDFGDLLLECITLFQRNPDVLAGYQRRFRYILVDEYQDTNVAQYLWLRLLAQGHQNLCCVGDDDQSIYSWRGAEVGNILRFEKDYPDATVVRLERNYRSNAHILGAASGLIAHNEGRLGKTLWTEDDSGEKIRIQGVWDGDEEARYVSDVIEHLSRQGHPLNEMAVLVRAGFQTRAFEDRFMQIGLPYRVIGGLRFFERQEIRDAIAYMRVTVQPDDDLAFERIVNKPKRGIGDATVQILHRHAREHGLSLTAATRELVATGELRPKVRATLRELLGLFDHWRDMLGREHHVDVVRDMLDASGYADMWRADKSVEAQGRLENLKELERTLEDFDSLAGFLEHVSLVMDRDAETVGEDMVNVMTLHGAKGLEFDTVFLPGWEEGVFPHERALEESGRQGLEEERRLAYVGITRARRRAVISFAANRRVYNQWVSSIPSRFVEELPGEHVEIAGGSGLYGGRADMRGGGGTGGEGVEGGMARHGVFERGEKRFAAGPVIEGEAVPVRHIERVPADANAGAFRPGQRVSHKSFGLGFIEAVDGDKLQVVFDKAGRKKVVDRFVDPV